MPLGMGADLSPGDFVLGGDPAPIPKRGRSPQFTAHVYCGQTAGWIKMLLLTEVGLGASSPPLKGHSPQFSANVCCGQTAGWTKMPLGTKVDHTGHTVLDRDPVPPRKGHSSRTK